MGDYSDNNSDFMEGGCHKRGAFYRDEEDDTRSFRSGRSAMWSERKMSKRNYWHGKKVAFFIVLIILFFLLANPVVYTWVGHFFQGLGFKNLAPQNLNNDLPQKLVILHTIVFAVIVALIYSSMFSKKAKEKMHQMDY
jgi:uncharacterized BrkB/YihY/UPF0761 family membrane protein